MTHEEAQLLLAAYLDDELSADQRAQVEEHTRGCSACAREVARMREASASLRQFRDEKLGERATSNLHRAIDRAAADDAGAMRLVATIGVLAASVLIVGLAWLSRLSSGTETRMATKWSATQPWEDVAVTLRPDPGALPRRFAPDQQFAGGTAGYDANLADWMLSGLNQRVDR